MVSKRKILFRADAGADIGYGHFIRTLALADMLKDDFECILYTQSPTEYQRKECENVCSLVELPADDTRLQLFLDCLSGDEIVVLDNYFYTTDYQRRIKDKGCKLVCIDDMHDKHYVADLIINQGIYWTRDDYSCEDYTRFAFGLRYSLLRKPFFEACKERQSKNSISDKLNVVVAFGGSDFLDLTQKTILGIIDEPIVKSITAIVGDRYSSEKMIESPKVVYKKNLSAKEIAEIFMNTDVAILPASTMMNEALACGAKIIGGYYVRNQEYDYYAFLKENLIEGVDDYSDDDSVRRIRKVLGHIRDKALLNTITPETPQIMVELFKSL